LLRCPLMCHHPYLPLHLIYPTHPGLLNALCLGDDLDDSVDSVDGADYDDNDC